MKSFKEYISEQSPIEPMPDWSSDAMTSKFNKALRDKDKWPPHPAVKYKAQQTKWKTGKEGKGPTHLAKVGS